MTYVALLVLLAVYGAGVMAISLPSSSIIGPWRVALVVAPPVIAQVIYLIATYNRLVLSRLAVEETWSRIEVALELRARLIPSLTDTVALYSTHEQATLERVSRARARLTGADSPEEAASADAESRAALGSLFYAVQENYPDLKANANYISLQSQLRVTEDDVSAARLAYNRAVFSYNALIQQVPTALAAPLLGFSSQSFFESNGG